MRLYDTPDDECMHNVAFVSKSSHNYELPYYNPPKPTSNKRSRWVLVDVLLITSLLGGCAWYYQTTAAQSATREILARLAKAKLEQSTRTEEHQQPLHQPLHVEEAEEAEKAADEQNAADETSNPAAQPPRPDSIFHKMVHEAKQSQHAEDAIAHAVHERLSATTNEADRLNLERLRDHHQRLQLPPAFTPLRNGNSNSNSNSDSNSNSNINTGGTNTSNQYQFRTGDIVEFYDPHRKLNSKWQAHLFAPHQVESSRSHGSEVLYDIVCNADGTKKVLPERYLRLYHPFEVGTEAICNMGSFEVKRFFPCTVMEYVPKATRGPEVLHGTYEVRIGPYHMRSSDSGYDLPIDHVPVWKVERQEPARGTDEL